MTDFITKTDLSLIFSIISLIFTSFSAILASYAAVKVVAMEKSTHSLQYMPVDPQLDKENQAFMEQMSVDDNWATSDDSIRKQQEIFKKDMEENLEYFYPEEEDKKTFSF